MPTYDYECKVCKHKLEAFHSMNAAPLRDCPKCGKPELKKKIGAGAGIIFKGSGFYETDYRPASYAAAKAKDKPAEVAAPTKDAPKPATPATTE